MIFKNIENRMPILTGGFHANIVAIVCNQLISKEKEIGVHGAKGFWCIAGDVVFVCCGNGGNDGIFMNIDTTTNGIGDFY